MKQHIENFLDVPGPDPKNSIKTTYRKGELRCLIRLMNYWITNNTCLLYTSHQATFFYESAANLVLFIMMMIVARRAKKDGWMTVLYLVGYGIIRCCIEGDVYKRQRWL